MIAPSTRTSFLSLPDELLEYIVEPLVAGRRQRPTGLALTCRRLANLVRRMIFREIDYGGDAHRPPQTLIQQAFRINPSARGLVCSLNYTPRYKDEGEFDHVGDPELPYLFFIFPAIRHLCMRSVASQHVEAFINGPPTANDGTLRHLEVYLMIDCDQSDDRRNADLRRPGWWNPLRRCTNLESLAIVAAAGDESAGEELAVETSQLLPLEHVRTLVVSAAIYPSSGLPLSTLLPNLEVLTVRVFDHEDELVQLSHLVRTAPHSLVDLRIVCRFSFGTSQSVAETLNALSDRSTLRHLTLPGAEFDADGLSRYLLSSSLCSLTFTTSCPFSDVLLLQLVAGEARMKCLEVLRLDHFGPVSCEAVRYTLTNVLVGAIPAGLVSALKSAHSYCAPVWPEGCTPAGLRRVVDEARLNGIRVCGWALDSLEWEQVFDEEVERCLVDIANEKEDRSLIDEYFGREKADEAIERHAWRFASVPSAAATS